MKKIILVLAVLTVFLSSCKKDFTELEKPIANKTMVDLTIDDNFNWKTTKDIVVKLTGSTGARVLINSTEGTNYHKGMLTSDAEYVTKITIPTYINEVELAYNGQELTLNIENNKIEYHFN
ncbi:MAG: hypothetical protein H8E34_05055 [Bacteroidetes bacterium]|nr:hypothetical protein [Bacteroidota bacterium]